MTDEVPVMARRTLVTALIVGAAALSVGLAGCNKANPADNLAPTESASPTKSHAPGGLTSTDLVMTKPKNGKGIITGTLLNSGIDSEIVSVTSPVATGFVLRNGTSKVSGIPAPPNGAKPSVTLSPSGYNIELTGVNTVIDPGGEITVYLLTSAKQQSQMQVKVK